MIRLRDQWRHSVPADILFRSYANSAVHTSNHLLYFPRCKTKRMNFAALIAQGFLQDFPASLQTLSIPCLDAKLVK